MTGNRDFINKNVIVTGAGRGLGKAIAIEFARRGSSVALFGKTEENLVAVSETINQFGGKSFVITGDVRATDHVNRCVDETLKRLGGIDILINCAGIFRSSPSDAVTLEDWNEIIDTNLTGTYLFCKVAGQEMLKKGDGKIVNFCSLLSHTAFPERMAYASSKGGVLQLTKVLGIEWIKKGINVNAISPGMIQVAGPHPTISQESLINRIPAGRIGKPSDIVGPVMFLASEDANYIAGQTIVVDGGWLSDGFL